MYSWNLAAIYNLDPQLFRPLCKIYQYFKLDTVTYTFLDRLQTSTVPEGIGIGTVFKLAPYSNVSSDTFGSGVVDTGDVSALQNAQIGVGLLNAGGSGSNNMSQVGQLTIQSNMSITVNPAYVQNPGNDEINYNKGWLQVVSDKGSMGTNLSEKVWRGIILQQDLWLPLVNSGVAVTSLRYLARYKLSFKGIRYLVTDPRPQAKLLASPRDRPLQESDIVGSNELGEGHHRRSFQGDHGKFQPTNTWMPRLRHPSVPNLRRSTQTLGNKNEITSEATTIPRNNTGEMLDITSEGNRGGHNKPSLGEIPQLLQRKRPFYDPNGSNLYKARKTTKEEAKRRNNEDDIRGGEAISDMHEISSSNLKRIQDGKVQATETLSN